MSWLLFGGSGVLFDQPLGDLAASGVPVPLAVLRADGADFAVDVPSSENLDGVEMFHQLRGGVAKAPDVRVLIPGAIIVVGLIGLDAHAALNR
jgi:hypothetical protein